MSPALRLNICAITAGMENYKLIKKSITKQCCQQKLNTIEVLASKDLSDSYINYDEFVYVINVLRNYNEIKKEITNPKKCWGIY